jgi:hypothetical protein
MKLRVLSDLHLEFQDWRPPQVPADVIVLAGDIHAGIEGILWGRKHFPEMCQVTTSSTAVTCRRL